MQKKDSFICDHGKSVDAKDELSVTSRHNELMCSVYEIFTKSAATTRYTEMCKRKVREMIDFMNHDFGIVFG